MFRHRPQQRRRRGRGGGRTKTTRRNVYRKELFLHANFRFLVADWADLRGAATDPDHMVDWDDVVAVELGAAAPLACPVCLDEPPNAPQVTLCGHSFCFACIARHAVTNRKDGEHAKCPMCFTPVRMADLRSVRRRPIAPPVVGGKMRLTLLRRRRESAVPSKYTPSEGNGSLPGVTTSWPRSTRSIDGGAFDAFAKYTLTSE